MRIRFLPLLFFLLFCPGRARAQIKQPCPVNTSPLPRSQTVDNADLLYRQPICVDANGRIVFNGGNANFSTINGVFKMDGEKYPCTMAGLQQIIADAEAAGGATVDARLCTSMTLTAETDVGDGTHAITLILPSAGTWNLSTISDGVSCFLKVNTGSSIVNEAVSNGANRFTLQDSGTVNADSMICTAAGAYSRIDAGALLYNPGPTFGTYVNGLFDWNSPVDASVVRGLTMGNYNGIGFLAVAPCCGSIAEKIVTNGNGQTGAQPFVLKTGTQATGPVAFVALSADHAGAGQNEISISQPSGNLFEANFFNVYVEGNTAAATAPHVDVSISNGSVLFSGLQVYSRNSSEAVYGAQIENNTGSVQFQNYGFFGTATTRDLLDDLKNSIAITSTASSNAIERYSTANPFSIDEIGQTALSGGAGSKIFTLPFRVSPVVCSAADMTAAAAVKANATTTTLTLAGTSSDVISWDCKGN